MPKILVDSTQTHSRPAGQMVRRQISALEIVRSSRTWVEFTFFLIFPTLLRIPRVQDARGISPSEAHNPPTVTTQFVSAACRRLPLLHEPQLIKTTRLRPCS